MDIVAPMTLRTTTWTCLLSSLCGMVIAGSALAEADNASDDGSGKTVGLSGLQSHLPGMEKLKALKQKIEQEPKNLDHYFAYAQMAKELREYEKAAAMYERMLEAVPDMPRVKLELATTYIWLGRHEEAEPLLKELAATDLPDTVEENIAKLQQQVDQATRRHFVSGSISTGVFADSNANAAPESGIVTIRFNGQELPFELSDGSDAQSDLQLFGALNVNHIYRPPDLKLGDGISGQWRSAATYYRNEYEHLDALNIQLYSAQTGPELVAMNGRLKSWLAFGYNHIRLANQTFQRQYRASLSTRYRLTPETLIRLQLTEEIRDFINTDSSQRLDRRDGDSHRVQLGVIHQFTPKDRLQASLQWRRENTERVYFDNTMLDGSLAYTHNFDAGWFSQLQAGYRHSTFDGPDPSISLTTREEDEWRGGFTVGKRFDEGVSISTGYQYRNVNASLTNFEFDNHRLMSTLAWAF